jgi:hypothetical protein
MLEKENLNKFAWKEKFTTEQLLEFSRLGGLGNRGRSKNTRIYLSQADKQRAYRSRIAKAKCQTLNQNKKGLVFVINPKTNRIVRFRNNTEKTVKV